MMNLSRLSAKPLRIIPKWIIIVFLIVSFIGFLDAVYLTAKHYLGTSPYCSFLEGCEEVLNSRYSTIGSLPVSFVGAIYYLFVFLLTIIYFDTKKAAIFYLAVYFTSAGFLASLWFLYLQFFVIKAFCLYCLISVITSILLFIFGLFALKLKKC